MGSIVHKSVIVFGEPEEILIAQTKAKEIYSRVFSEFYKNNSIYKSDGSILVSEIVSTVVNG